MKPELQILLKKFYQNKCNREEIDQLIDYLRQEDNPEGFPEVRDVLNDERILEQLNQEKSEQIFSQILAADKAMKIDWFRQPWVKVAAAVSAFLVLAFAFLLWQSFHQTTSYNTHFAEVRTVELPDGSVVTLNANSKISMNDNWDEKGDREVWLEGEAFFAVVHTGTDQRFIVHTSDDFSVEVLGTRFNVKDRRNRTSVVLSSGKVKVKAKGINGVHEKVMQPGDKVDYKKRERTLDKRQVNVLLYTSWKDNLMMFDNQRLEKVAERIQDQFGYEVRFESDSLRALSFTGSSPADDLDLLLTTLSKSFDLKITKNQEQIMINSR